MRVRYNPTTRVISYLGPHQTTYIENPVQNHIKPKRQHFSMPAFRLHILHAIYRQPLTLRNCAMGLGCVKAADSRTRVQSSYNCLVKVR